MFTSTGGTRSGRGNRQMGVTSGITFAPPYSPQQQQQSLGNYDAMRPVGGRAGDLYDTLSPMAKTSSDRMMSLGNAQHVLHGQQARANSGLGWARQGYQIAQQNRAYQMQQDQMAWQLLRALGGF